MVWRCQIWNLSDTYHNIFFQSRKQLYNRKCLSVCPSVSHRNPLASQNGSYQSLSLSTIMPIWPSDLCPAFATFELFWLVSNGVHWIECINQKTRLVWCIQVFHKHVNKCIASSKLVTNGAQRHFIVVWWGQSSQI